MGPVYSLAFCLVHKMSLCVFPAFFYLFSTSRSPPLRPHPTICDYSPGLSVRPLIVPSVFSSWSDKLWWNCCDEDGKPNKDINDPRLIKILPSFIWDIVQKSDEELEIGDVPYIVASLHNKGEVDYDGIIIKGIGETEAGNIVVDDYCVFSTDQVKEI